MSFRRLSELVGEAEQMHKIREGQGAIEPQRRRGGRMRMVSPLDDLLPDDEADFCRREQQVIEKSEA